MGFLRTARDGIIGESQGRGSWRERGTGFLGSARGEVRGEG